FNSASITVSNLSIAVGRSLSFSATNLLTDTDYPGANSWSVGDGVNLWARPAAGDLRGTTIQSTAPIFGEVLNFWAGEDRGCAPAGFTNNGALGRLILDGGDDSQFTFRGTGAQNGLYVDYLELR